MPPAVRASPSLSGSARALVAGVAVAVLIYSLWEWSVHRYIYHRVLAPRLKPAYLTHHRDHHYREFPPWRFTGEEGDGGSSERCASR